MLSRVAERMYWMGRYIERAENIARLVNVNASLQLDLPRGVKPPWHALTDIMDITEEFLANHANADERTVIRFMLAGDKNPSSLLSTVASARENARTTREILPSEVFESITELNFFARKGIDRALARSGRQDYLNSIVNQCHQITGTLFGTMSHDLGYGYIRLGRNIERADMTTRILDVGSTRMLAKGNELPETYNTALWMSVLRSISAYQMYRQHVLDRVNAEDVVEFLLKDPYFPRSVAHCISELKLCCALLPRGDDPQRQLATIGRQVAELNVPAMLEDGLHAYIDGLQLDIGVMHDDIVKTWFAFDHASVRLARAQ
jgi:uncharacterized alpha-E superfamily protein